MRRILPLVLLLVASNVHAQTPARTAPPAPRTRPPSAITAPTSASAPADTMAFGALRHLIGTWMADPGSGGQPGVATSGGEVWMYDLAGHVIERRNFSAYAATKDHPGITHTGLTVIAPAENGAFTAHDYDSEGHVIDYAVAVADSAIVLTSPATSSAPQFRLTYRPIATGYSITFEIATPDHPGVFQSYVTGTIQKLKQ